MWTVTVLKQILTIQYTQVYSIYFDIKIHQHTEPFFSLEQNLCSDSGGSRSECDLR